MEYYKKNGCQHQLTKEAQSLTFAVTTSITADKIENIVVTALECQSNYWAGIDNTTPEWNNAPEDLPVSQFATQLLLEGKAIKLYDVEDEDEQWELDLQKLLKGVGIAMAAGDDIEDECDNVIQYALFGELVYG